MNNNEETRSTKIMKAILVVVFFIAIALGVTSYLLDDSTNNKQTIKKQESPF